MSIIRIRFGGGENKNEVRDNPMDCAKRRGGRKKTEMRNDRSFLHRSNEGGESPGANFFQVDKLEKKEPRPNSPSVTSRLRKGGDPAAIRIGKGRKREEERLLVLLRREEGIGKNA